MSGASVGEVAVRLVDDADDVSGSERTKSRSSAAEFAVPVGLLGVARITSFVLGVTARARAFRSFLWFTRGTSTGFAPKRMRDKLVDHELGQAHDHLVPRVQEDVAEELDDLVRAVADDELVGGEPVEPGEAALRAWQPPSG
jgi:hypothetical protein